MPGGTPYVTSEADLIAFLDRIERNFDYFFGELSVEAMTPAEIKAQLQSG